MNTRSDSTERRDANVFPERFVPMPRRDPRPWRPWLRLWALPTLLGLAWGAAAVSGVLLALIPLLMLAIGGLLSAGASVTALARGELRRAAIDAALAALWCAATLTAGSMVAAAAPSSPC